jgi:hypothetical protein
VKVNIIHYLGTGPFPISSGCSRRGDEMALRAALKDVLILFGQISAGYKALIERIGGYGLEAP